MQHALFRALCLIVALFVAAPAHAQLKVDVTQGHVDPMEIAIPAFSGPNGADMAGVIRANLESSGLFDAQDPAAFIERGLQVNATPRFADWRVIKSEALVVGAASVDGGRLRVDFRVWDVFGEEQLLGLQFEAGPDAWRRIAHKISDAIYERLTGLPGSFDTRVVFVSQSGGKLNRVKRLAIMDQDGANPSFLTDGSEQILNPRFSPSNQQIAYAALSDRGLKVWVLDIDTGRREVIAGLPGMSYAPRFSPDGTSVVLSGDADGNAEIYIKNLRSGSVSRLTNNPGIDTSPDISPDGSRIVFNSDRGGSPQLYVMARDGSGPRRISFGPGRYSTPVWSPNGEMIAFTRQTGARFQIGVMRADGSGERILSESYFEEGPTWAPNSQSIMFTRENPDGSTAIWAVDVSGRNLRRVPAPGQALDPAWSPRLP